MPKFVVTPNHGTCAVAETPALGHDDKPCKCPVSGHVSCRHCSYPINQSSYHGGIECIQIDPRWMIDGDEMTTPPASTQEHEGGPAQRESSTIIRQRDTSSSMQCVMLNAIAKPAITRNRPAGSCSVASSGLPVAGPLNNPQSEIFFFYHS